MKEQLNRMNRRGFLKKVGAAGLGSAFVFAAVNGDSKESKGVSDVNSVEDAEDRTFGPPKRKFGQEGIKVPCLGLGTNRLSMGNRVVLKKAYEYGVTLWDTSPAYIGGQGERCIGEFVQKNPDARAKLFIVSKATEAVGIEQKERLLQMSLRRMNLQYIDLYLGVHQMDEPSNLNDELQRWAEAKKKKKQIRYLGFSTHKNMTRCLEAAARLDWIDVVMTSYNFRLMQDKRFNAAIEACREAGIGIIAIKTQGHGVNSPEDAWQKRYSISSERDRELTRHLLEKGYTQGQAKIKLVLENKCITSACVGLTNLSFLDANVAAVMDRKELSPEDKRRFKDYAQATCSGYCAGCAYICDGVLPGPAYVSDIMRYLMYYNSYGEKGLARKLFAAIPEGVRSRMPDADYGAAEALCPQRLAIGELVAEAVSKLS